ncbi:MAG TPA: glycosyltransferase family 4 protein [Thermoleophilaceae bacterium]|nr:glycosyltransferase family 4 protein [Thermoleophilaceae bacterium]
MKPAALITNRVSDYRREPFELLAGEANVKVIAWDEGRLTQLGAVREAASGRYRAVICGLGGRIALPGSYAAARRRRIPFVLWASIWGHPRTAAHALSYLPTRHLYRHADAVVTYGSHVTRYVNARRGSKGNVFEAPQAVESWFAQEITPERRAHVRMHAGVAGTAFMALFVGRLEREKGVPVLLEAWRSANLGENAVLVLAGEGPLSAQVESAGPGIEALGFVPRDHLPSLYAAADVLVLPSIRTETFLEPWGLVVNEAMHQGTPAIVSDAVGAAAGGLVQDGRNGLVAPQGDAGALAARIRSLALNPGLREGLGQAARHDVVPFTYAAWVSGMRLGLAAVGADLAR